jgi:hypothetical protein
MAPGVTWEGRKVYRVVHQITPDGTRARVTYDRSERDEFRAAVRGAFPELLYLSSWEGRVIGQNADGTLEILAYDPRIGGLSKVPYRPGLPGTTLALPSSGTRVQVAFEGASAASAYACNWMAATALDDVSILASGEIGLDAQQVTVNGGNKNVARVGDIVKACSLLWDATTSTLYLANGYPQGVGGLQVYTVGITVAGVTGVMPNPNSPAPPAPGTPGTDVNAIITTGALRFFA